MIRTLIARVRAAVNTPGVQMAIAGMALKLAADIIVNTVSELREEMTLVQQQLAEVRLESAAAARVLYPTAEDLDPMGRGSDSPIGDDLAEEYARP